VNDPTVWQYLQSVVRALFPGIIILRLADSDRPNMDKLFFYVRRLDKCLEKSKEILDTLQDKLYATGIGMKYGKIDAGDDEAAFAVDDCSSDTDSDDGFLGGPASLGAKLIEIWNRRKEKLINDYSISAWLLCPMKEVFEDARDNHKGEHRDAMERLFRKLYLQSGTFDGDDEKRDNVVNVFWREFENFQAQTGIFGGGRSYIWTSSTDLAEGNSHLWHKMYSYRYTICLGQFACRVTSKVLGIGAAERNWGEVKHLKTDKRSHLGGDRTKKQATIFGADCAERAKIQRAAIQKGNQTDDQFMFWDEEDFDQALGIDFDNDNQVKRSPMRIVNCWIEDWEAKATSTYDPVCEAKLLKKYGGLEWIDIDNNVLCRTGDTLKWLGKRQQGWNVIGYTENWIETDPNRDQHWDYWSIFKDCPLHDCLLEYYTKKKSAEFNVLAIRQDGTSIEDEESV